MQSERARVPGRDSLTLTEAYDMIKEFHLKHDSYAGLPIPIDQDQEGEIWLRSLETHADFFKALALRNHLIGEELSEFNIAAFKLDRALMLDAATDLLYVVIGLFVTYGINDPAGLLREVHSSNMTKKVSGDQRVADKGESFVPPDFTRWL